MYKSELANHPWLKLRDRAAYVRSYRHIGRDLKIGQLWIMLVVLIVMGTTIAGTYLTTTLNQPQMSGELGKFIATFTYQRALLVCAFTIIQCIFVLIGSKFMVRLLTWQLVPIALLGLATATYFASFPETRTLALLVFLGFSPYILCAGILTLSWRARLYLSYMQGT
ncbi:MAG: hypothetical protein U0175_36915 [Caldilineaceae bacterium]